MSIKTDLESLAKTIRAQAGASDTPLSESIDAFKALTAYYALTLKAKAKGEDDEDSPGGADFGKFSAEIEGAHRNGRSPVPGRRDA